MSPTRRPPRLSSSASLAALAMARLRAELQAAPADDRPAIVAARQIAPDHVRALGAAVGLNLTRHDFAELQARAEEAVRHADIDFGDPIDEALVSAGVAMRAAAAEYLAERCSEHEDTLAASSGNPGLSLVDGWRPTTGEWRALITEFWRLLPLMRPVEIGDLLAARDGGRSSRRALAYAA